MVSSLTVVDSTLEHAIELGQNLRKKDRLEASRMGLDPERACIDAFEKCIYRKTALVDGRIGAMWGVWGSPLAGFGTVSFITSKEAEKVHPVRFARLYISETQEMLQVFNRLENFVDSKYPEAVKLLKLAGYTVERKNHIINGHRFKHFHIEAGGGL